MLNDVISWMCPNDYLEIDSSDPDELSEKIPLLIKSNQIVKYYQHQQPKVGFDSKFLFCVKTLTKQKSYKSKAVYKH